MTNRFLALVPTMFLVACGSGPADGDDDDVANAEAAATATAGTAEVATVSAWFLPVEDSDERVADAIAALEAAVAVPDCVTVESDEATYVDATFACPTIDGTVRGDLELSGGVVWAVTADLTIADTTIAGTWEILAAFQSGIHSFNGDVEVTGGWGTTITSHSAAVWDVGDDGCLALDGSAETSTGLTAAIDGFDVCPDACPSNGTVSVTTPRGSLAWSYDGSATTTVTTGAGRTITLPLYCGR